jgi:hypothetical protein
MRTLNFRGLSVILGLAPLACSAQADPDYRGEPLATIRGTVTTGDHPPSTEMEAALIWLQPEALTGGAAYVVGRSRVTGNFPANFTLEILEPPPPDAGFTDGFIAAIPAQSAPGQHTMGIPSGGPEIDPWSLLGVAEHAGIVYFPQDSQAPGDDIAFAAEFYKVPPVKGYHLWRSEVTRESEAAAFQCESEGLCARPVYDEPEKSPAENAALNARAVEDQARCLQYVPGAEACTLGGATTPEEIAESTRCGELVTARYQRQQASGTVCPRPWVRLDNPEGFATPVTVTLGRNFLDLLIPLYRE